MIHVWAHTMSVVGRSKTRAANGGGWGGIRQGRVLKVQDRFDVGHVNTCQSVGTCLSARLPDKLDNWGDGSSNVCHHPKQPLVSRGQGVCPFHLSMLAFQRRFLAQRTGWCRFGAPLQHGSKRTHFDSQPTPFSWAIIFN